MPLCRPAAPKHAGKQVKRGMPKIPLYYQDGEFFEEFGTSCYINHEKMVDVFPLYRHDFIEISLILDGCGTELCNGKYYPCLLYTSNEQRSSERSLKKQHNYNQKWFAFFG